MFINPKFFYKTYIKDYHYIKALYLKKLHDNQEKYELEIFEELIENDEDRDAFRKTLKIDIRQNYFHSIETFFELFFALNPLGPNGYDDENILFNLTNSNWKRNYKKINEIADNSTALDYLDKKIKFLDYEITVGHYLFYNGVFSKEKFPQEVFENITKSIDAIKYGINVIARDFVDREEYNCYKHGLRIIPFLSKLAVANRKDFSDKIVYDLNDSMSFFQKFSTENELKLHTKLFDTERDFQLTLFCSNLIRHIINFRKYSMFKMKENEKNEQIVITFFGKEQIEKCHKINTEINDLVYTLIKENNGNG